MFGKAKRLEVVVRIEGMAEVVNLLKQLVAKEGQIMATLQDILDEATKGTTVADSVLALVRQLVAEQDPVARQRILDQLTANRAKVEEAILAGTPQAP